VADSDARPTDRFYERMQRQLGANPRRTLSWRAMSAAAALVLLSLLGGTWLGRTMLPVRTVAVPVVVRTPGAPAPIPAADTGSPSRILLPADCPAVGPPRPDRIVQLVPGENPRPGVSAGGNRP